MILTRMGNKRRIADKILPLFPKHDLYIEPFFGAGGLFFSKPKVKYNIVNDADGEVHNLFSVVRDKPQELAAYWRFSPQHEQLFRHWLTHQETEPVLRAARFLYLSNYSFLGKQDTLSFGVSNTKLNTQQRLPLCAEALEDVVFDSVDFRQFFKRIHFPSRMSRAFCYADPPYLGTDNNYDGGNRSKWKPTDTSDLLDAMQARDGLRFALSEFDHPFVLEQAEKRGLTVHTIGDRRNLGNVRTEILLTNY